MTVTRTMTWTCDRCRTEWRTEQGPKQPHGWSRFSSATPALGELHPAGDYCSDCAQAIKRFMSGGANVGEGEAARLQVLLRNVVVAAGRMSENWAEGDEGVKKALWRNLHAAAEAAHEDVYPL